MSAYIVAARNDIDGSHQGSPFQTPRSASQHDRISAVLYVLAELRFTAAVDFLPRGSA